MTPSSTWNALDSAVNIYNESDREDLAVKRALQDAVYAYVAARPPSHIPPTSLPPPSAADGAVTLPFGRAKGKTIADASTDDLRWIGPKIRESVDDPSKARWRDANVALADAIETELGRR